ncbi:MAG: nucleoside deaminase [Candidatus Omnitrophica bacterium]|nr:nucleoside deaminase [Candidatus Omnitrophota bacterium]
MDKRLNKKYMLLAIQEARKNLKNMQGGPFGACIVKEGKVLAVSRNTVLKTDATAHAEVNAIRAASRKLKTFDLSGCIIYSTTEPCPMCFSAIHWSRIGVLAYGTDIADVKKLGFYELDISCKKLKSLGKSRIEIFPDFLLKECNALLSQWEGLECRAVY